MRETLLKLHQADIGPEEMAAVDAVLTSGWLTKGPRTRLFEERFAEYVEAPHALGVNSCTAALHLALLVCGIGPGDEVIVPALTFAASANTVVHCGATPVFADVLPATHCIDPASVARQVTDRTRAIVPVHFAGIPAPVNELCGLADRHKLAIIEDCAHAVETQLDGAPVGVAGCPATRFAAYSFYATKNLISGEGGMLTCREESDLDRARVLGLHGMSADAWKRYAGADGGDTGFKLYDIVAAGYKYNMFDLQAALGLVQLAKLERNWQLRRRHVARYLEGIAGIGGVSPLKYPAKDRSAHHIFVVRLDKDLAGNGPQVRNRVITELRLRNVEAYVHFICLTGTQFYREQYHTHPEDTPVAASLSERSITLPLFPGMTEDDIDYVVAMLEDSIQAVMR